MILAKKPELSEPKNAVFDSKTAILTPNQCGLFCLLGRDQKIEMKLGCENIMSQNTIVQRIGLIERLTS